ncbi:MAG: ABC transporter permease subunit [Oscillospiraceae bacterium]
MPSYARVIRSEFARHREMNYVKSARLMGAGHLRIMFLHILPNTRQNNACPRWLLGLTTPCWRRPA